MGFEVFSAADGLEGIKMAEEREYVLIILDVHMPKMRGPEVLKRIKEFRPEQVVVVFSSSSDPYMVFEKQAKKSGSFDCLYKPVDLEDILKVMTNAGIRVNK